MKYKKVEMCVNCIRKTKDCTCVSRLTDILVHCGNCDSEVYDEIAQYCSQCGEKLEDK